MEQLSGTNCFRACEPLNKSRQVNNTEFRPNKGSNMNTMSQNETAKSGNNKVADKSQNKSNEVKNITQEVFKNRLIRKQGENVMPHIIHEKITKKNVLDNSLRPSHNEICNIIRREFNDTKC